MPFVSGARGYGGRAACSLLAGAYAPGGDVVVQAGLSLYPFPADFATNVMKRTEPLPGDTATSTTPGAELDAEMVPR